MNKRSAMMVAAGLVLAMLVAGMAVAAGFTGSDATAAGSRAATGELQRREPRVRTITETVTVRRDAKPSDDGALAPTVVTQSPSGSTLAPDPSDDGDWSQEYEHEDDDEDGFESQHDDGDDGYESEGHEDEDD